MNNGRFVSYLRVSTAKQGRSGLGLDAQREAVARYLDGGNSILLGEYVEIESGKANNRPQLADALKRCRMTGATLIVAKIDRLARNTRFLLTVYEDSGEGGVVFCDLPKIPAGPAGKFLVRQMASVAELEADLISERTKVALQAARARGKVLGGLRSNHRPVDGSLGAAASHAAAVAFAMRLMPDIHKMQMERKSLREMAAELNRGSIRTRCNGLWSATQVKRVIEAAQG